MSTFVAIYHPNIPSTVDEPALVAVQALDEWYAKGWLLVDPDAEPPEPSTPYYTREAADSRFLSETAARAAFETWLAEEGGAGSGVVTVVHGGDPNIARPAIGTGTVRWVGWVQPAAMTTTDEWLEIAGPGSSIDPLTVADWMGAWYADQLVTAGAADGATVTSWTDATGGTLPLTPTASSTGAAVLDTMAPGYGQPAVKFTASPLGSPAFTALPVPYTVVIVANVGTTGEETVFHGEEGANAGTLFLAQGPLRWRASNGGVTYPEVVSKADTNPHIFIATFSSDPAVGRLRVDGLETIAATGSTSMASFRLGLWADAAGNEAYRLSGHVAFAALIDGALTPEQIDQLEAWAAGKYGLTVA